MLNLLQKIGKALMTPIAVLPVAALLLRLGFGDIFDGQVALIMKSAGETIFSHLDLLFGIGIAYGHAKNNDGAAALSGAIGVLIAKSVYLSIDKDVNCAVLSQPSEQCTMTDVLQFSTLSAILTAPLRI